VQVGAPFDLRDAGLFDAQRFGQAALESNSRAARNSSRAISSRVDLTRASTRTRDAAGSLFRSFVKFPAFAIVVIFLKVAKVLLVKAVR
jgi:hypothetical protein